jgi:hypothetical protein
LCEKINNKTATIRDHLFYLLKSLKTGSISSSPAAQQGDQIGRIFAQWVIVYFGQLLKICKSNVFGYFIHQFSLYINFDTNVLGYILAAFFTSSSGHTAAKVESCETLKNLLSLVCTQPIH